MDRLRKRIAELEGNQPTRVAPATFITEAMTSIGSWTRIDGGERLCAEYSGCLTSAVASKP